MGKCLNYPQTVLSEAIGCVYGIFSIVVLFTASGFFFTVPLRVFSVAVFFAFQRFVLRQHHKKAFCPQRFDRFAVPFCPLFHAYVCA